MSRIGPIELNQAEGKAKALLDNVQKALGIAPNLMRTLAHSPAALEAYLSFSKILGGGVLGAPLREQIALTVAGANGCNYCAAAHTQLGKRAGLEERELKANLEAASSDPKIEAVLQFARSVVEKRGFVGDDEIQRVRDAGFGDREITEIVAIVSLNLFSNYFNHVAQVEIDFPAVKTNQPACGCSS